MDTGNTGPPYGPNDNGRRNDYDTQGRHEDNHLPKLTRPDGNNDGSLAAQDVDSNLSGYSAPMPNSSMGLSRDRIPSIRDSVVGDGSNSGPPNVSRQMSLHDVTRQDGHDDGRRHGPQRLDNPQRDDRDNGGPNNMRDPSQQNGTVDGKSDRLPGMNSLPAPMDITSSRNGGGQDDGDMQGPHPQGSPPSLSLPSSGPLRSIAVNDNKQPSTSPTHGGVASSSPRTGGSGMGASLPPLSSGRNSGSLSRLSQDAKDMSSSGGMSSSLVGGLGSSLTKFGRAPPTPVSNSVVPSSLPSPLSHKPGGAGGAGGNQSMHGHSRSPRLAKTAAGGAFKAIQMPVPSPSYVPVVEQVPSPGSLPVLPPMSRPLPSYNTANDDDGNNHKMGKDKRVDGGGVDDHHHQRGVDDRVGVEGGRMKYMDDKADKDVGDSGGNGNRDGGSSGGGRGVSDDVLENKPVFGVLRPGNNSNNGDKDGGDTDDVVVNVKMKSPASSPNRIGSGGVGVVSGNDNSNNVLPNKRDSNMSSVKDDMGRTPKRPRLHDVTDKDVVKSSYGGYNSNNDVVSGGVGNDVDDNNNNKGNNNKCKDEDMVSGKGSGLVVGGGGKVSDSFKDSLKRVSNGSASSQQQQDDVNNNKKHHSSSSRRDSGGGGGGGNDLSSSSIGVGGPKANGGASGSGLVNSQVIELPRLSTQPMSKLSGPPLTGNQPLPSFRSERKNLSRGGSSGVGVGVSGGGGGGGGGGVKSLVSGGGGGTGDSGPPSRGGLPFALRSAPAPPPVSVPTIPTLKSLSVAAAAAAASGGGGGSGGGRDSSSQSRGGSTNSGGGGGGNGSNVNNGSPGSGSGNSSEAKQQQQRGDEVGGGSKGGSSSGSGGGVGANNNGNNNNNNGNSSSGGGGGGGGGGVSSGGGGSAGSGGAGASVGSGGGNNSGGGGTGGGRGGGGDRD